MFCGHPEIPADGTFCSSTCETFYAEERADHSSFCVGVFLCDRVCGGPEEGGWHYNRAQLVRSVRTFRHLAPALTFMRRMNKHLRSRKFGPNVGRRDMYSAASDGEYWAELHGTTCPKYYPEVKPTYE